VSNSHEKKGASKNMNHPMPDEPIDRYPYLEGTAVFDVAGERVGTLSAPDPQAGYLVVQKAGLLPTTFTFRSL
jgi:hypothetical protein